MRPDLQAAACRSSEPCHPPALTVVLGNSHNSMILGKTVQVKCEQMSPHTHTLHPLGAVSQSGSMASRQQSQYSHNTVQYIAIQYSSVHRNTLLCSVVQHCCKCLSLLQALLHINHIYQFCKGPHQSHECMQCLQVTLCKSQIHGRTTANIKQ